MRKAVFLAAAREDLVAILSFVAEASGSVATAERFVRTLRERCHALAALQTVMGRPRPDLGEDVRSHPFGSYTVLFRYRPDRFEVIGLVERHRDVAARFEADDR